VSTTKDQFSHNTSTFDASSSGEDRTITGLAVTLRATHELLPLTASARASCAGVMAGTAGAAVDRVEELSENKDGTSVSTTKDQFSHNTSTFDGPRTITGLAVTLRATHELLPLTASARASCAGVMAQHTRRRPGRRAV
jgi:hypothetical protein